MLLLLLTSAVIFSGLLGMLSDLVASVNKERLPTWNGQVRQVYLILQDGKHRKVSNKNHLQKQVYRIIQYTVLTVMDTVCNYDTRRIVKYSIHIHIYVYI